MLSLLISLLFLWEYMQLLLIFVITIFTMVMIIVTAFILYTSIINDRRNTVDNDSDDYNFFCINNCNTR